MNAIFRQFRLDFGARIALYRNLKGYTRKKIAYELRMSLRGYSAIENGEVSVTLERIITIAEILEIDPIQLFPGNTPYLGNLDSFEVKITKIEIQIQLIADVLK